MLKCDYIKTLDKAPKFINYNFSKNDVIIDLGNLSNYRKIMKWTETQETNYDDALTRTDNWSGVKSWEAYNELLENGDDDVIKNIKLETGKQLAKLGKKYEEEPINYKFDVTGQFFDVGLVMTGVPETWLDPQYEEVEKTKVDIVINGVFPDGTDLKKVTANAGKLLAMVKMLEDHNVQVSIKASIITLKSSLSNPKKIFCMFTHLKDYDEPINYQKCSSIISPTFLRRGACRLLECTFDNDMYRNYGNPFDIEGIIRLDNESHIDNLETKLFRKDK